MQKFNIPPTEYIESFQVSVVFKLFILQREVLLCKNFSL